MAHNGRVSIPAALDHDACYRAVRSRDQRFDGVFYTGVRTTGIYCRPSCPARTPAPRNVTFHPTAAAAQAAGFRACKRCLPDAIPGSPDWDLRADVAGRAMRLIGDGVVDREGVVGLARRLGYSPRHLGRLLTTELGAGPLALARARRAQTARSLLESTDLGVTDVAFAAGFSSVRQFNDTLLEVYGVPPSALRGDRAALEAPPGSLTLRVAVRTPFAGSALHAFLARRAVPGVETAGDGWYARTLRLPHGPGTVRLALHDLAGEGTSRLSVTFSLTDLRDTTAALERVRRLLDADCDPVAVDTALGSDPVLGPSVAAVPGLRVPGHVDGHEIAVRAVLGQQISVVRARNLAGRLAAEHGESYDGGAGLTRLFPSPAALAALDPTALPMPRARGRAVIEVSRAVAHGDLALDRAADRDEARRRLLEVPGIGAWTADYIAMRALGDPDAFLPTDLGVRRALERHDRTADEASRAWTPWRSYAVMHLWQPPDDEGDR